jgi:hypothetical protein
MFSKYTSRGHGCGIYIALIFVDSEALKQAHSKLRNRFSNAVYRQNRPIEIRIRDYAKYILKKPSKEN